MTSAAPALTPAAVAYLGRVRHSVDARLTYTRARQIAAVDGRAVVCQNDLEAARAQIEQEVSRAPLGA